MAVRLFVGNLPYGASEAELREHFSSVGPLAQVFMPIDRETGRPRGFAFVEFDDPALAADAVKRLNNQPFKGRPLAINEARARDAGAPSAPRMAPRYGEPPSGDAGRRDTDSGRRFGPDARPGRSRAGGRGQKFDRPKGPIRERPGGQLFSTDDVDDSSGPDLDIDNVATRAPDTHEDENE